MTIQFNIIESKKGLPVIQTMIDGKPLLLHSKFDPIREAERFIDSCKEKIEKADHVLFYGAGMGYHIKVFFEQYPEKIASVYEPFEEISKFTLQYMEQTQFPFSLLQHYVARTKEKLTIQDLAVFNANLNQKIEIIALPSYGEWQSDRLKEFIDTFKQLIDTKKGDVFSALLFSRRWTINALMNLPKTMEHPNFLVEKKQFFKGKPAIIVSAGPSLSEEIENLRFIKENGLAYIFAAGSAYKALIKENVYPDAVCTYDPQNHNYTIFRELVENDIDTIPMIYGSTVGFETVDYYKGPKLYFPVSQDKLIKYFHNDPQIIVLDATTIANVTLQLLNLLEVSKVILVGQNFAFKQDKYYADGIVRYDEKKKDESDNTATERDLELTFEVEDVHGGKVLTNDEFRRMKNDMETYVSIMKIPVINTTNGGAAIKGTKFKRLEEVINEDLTKKVVVDNWWKSLDEKREVLNKSFLKKYNEAFEKFEEQNDNLQQYLNEFKQILSQLNEQQIQRKLEGFDNLFQIFHSNHFYETTILPIATVAFEKLTSENELIVAMTNLKQKAEKVIEVYSNYLQQCWKIYLEIAPIISYYTLKKLEDVSGKKSYTATSGIFHYEGEWSKKYPPEKERMPENLTEDEQREWFRVKKIEDKIDIPLPTFVETTKKGAKIQFLFKGIDLTLYGLNNSKDDLKIKIQIDNKNSFVTIPGNQNETNESNIRKSIFSLRNLKNKMHEVEIEVLSENPYFLFDGIEISSGRAYHIHEVEQVEDLKVGKRIRCHYEATYNTVGEFSGLGQETAEFLPINPVPEPNGDFYFIMVDEINGEKKLIADRDLQNYISWDTLNDSKLTNLQGSNALLKDGMKNGRVRLLTGGFTEQDKNEWDDYVVNSNLNGLIIPSDELVWNWGHKSFSWVLDAKYCEDGKYRAAMRSPYYYTDNSWKYLDKGVRARGHILTFNAMECTAYRVIYCFDF